MSAAATVAVVPAAELSLESSTFSSSDRFLRHFTPSTLSSQPSARLIAGATMSEPSLPAARRLRAVGAANVLSAQVVELRSVPESVVVEQVVLASLSQTLTMQ